MNLVFTCMPGESYHRWLGSLLSSLFDIFQALVNSLVDSKEMTTTKQKNNKNNIQIIVIKALSAKSPRAQSLENITPNIPSDKRKMCAFWWKFEAKFHE